jgi:riboflavin synthase
LFTGIIETVGTVTSLARSGELARIEIEAPVIATGVRVGDSVAVSGACLTVTRAAPPRLCFEAVRETLERTSLGTLEAGSRVNLERALRADGRLDGHIVQGHVDATGSVRALERHGTDVRFVVATSPDFAAGLVPKGSVAIDGVSLTGVGVAGDGFDVVLIPHTLEETTLGERRPGDPVNLEADVLGKYVKRYLARMLGSPSRPQETP